LRRWLVLALAGAVLASGCGPKPIYRTDPRRDGGGSGSAGEEGAGGAAGPVGPAPVAPVPKTRIEEVASVWLGTPYRYGGVDERGLDCSALTQIVMGDLGVRIPRTTRDQFRSGRSLDRAELRAGDLLFFRLGSGRVDHVAIALGPDRFIHASSSRGVVVDRLMSEYYARRFVQARRVLPE
jgi:cell wall-associated NlpC family hydrolase